MSNFIIRVVDGDSPLLVDILKLRAEVFIHEQGVSPADEIDNLDGQATHIAAVFNEVVIGTLRMLPENGQLHVGRFAVRKNHRKRGIGSDLLRAAERYASENNFSGIILAAQISVVPFYEKRGYSKYGDVFLDAGIDHVWMSKKF
ncbi:MAG: GNAT family N-acetyltransferase [Candidatus Peribacteraceae bacterium]|nr:GNAT family N-acetyltransferase [Candidatus Peribacteraceae bacterium]